MAGISEIVQVTITANTRTPSRKGFGTPMLLAYHTKWTDRVRTYTGLDGLASDGFSPTDPNGRAVYLMALALLSQDPRPESFKVARLKTPVTQTKRISMTGHTTGDVISFTVTDPSGLDTLISYTVPGGPPTLSAVATAVAALVDPLTGIAATTDTADVVVTASTPGQVFFLRDFINCRVTDTTAAGSYAGYLDELVLADDDWYFLLLDINSKDMAVAVAAWVETKVKEYAVQTQDTGETDGSGTYGTTIKGLSYERTEGIFSRREDQYPACAWIGSVAPKDPGSLTWRFRNLKGVTPTLYSATQEASIRASGWNFYTTVAGLSMVLDGVTFSGEYPDVRHGTDWLQARIQERVLGVLANADKVPYEDSSVDMICMEIKAVLAIGERQRFLAKGTSTATGPKVADVDPALRAARVLPDINFASNLAGAVHKVQVVGTLSV